MIYDYKCTECGEDGKAEDRTVGTRVLLKPLGF